MSTEEPNAPLVELTAEPSRRRTRAVVAVAVAAIFLGGVIVVASTRDGEPTPTEALAEVREFVDEARTATFVMESESTMAPDSDELGETFSSRSRATGRLRLPDATWMLVDDGDFLSEFVSIGEDRYERGAERRGELQETKWVKWSLSEAQGRLGSAGTTPADVAIETAGGAMAAMSGGSPIEIDILLDKLRRPERVAPNRIRATATLADVVPDEVKQAIDELRAEAEADAEEEGNLEATFSPLKGTVTATIEYGPEGRLDVLELELVNDAEELRATSREVIRFADWGEPVTIEAPGADSLDHTPHLEEEKLAVAQQRYRVFAATTPPAGWKLLSVYVESKDEEAEVCESVSVEYGTEEEPAIDSDAEPPALEIVSVEPGCEWLSENLPDMSAARQVRIGPWSARLVAENEDNFLTFLEEGISAVLELEGTTVVAASNLPEDQLLQVLRSLAPLDLARQPVAAPPG